MFTYPRSVILPVLSLLLAVSTAGCVQQKPEQIQGQGSLKDGSASDRELASIQSQQSLGEDKVRELLKKADSLYQKGDLVGAFAVYKLAAEMGHARGMFNLGVMYKNGEGVQQDDAKAVVWFGKAAEQRHTLAMFNLGVMYKNGEGVQQDDAEAVVWFRKAAEQGDTEAMFILGVMYEIGKGIQQDYAEAFAWYRKAADKGDTEAMFALGWMYYEGRGVKQDDAEAVAWFGKAAEQGHVTAMESLAYIYQNGALGVNKDTRLSEYWSNKASLSRK